MHRGNVRRRSSTAAWMLGAATMMLTAGFAAPILRVATRASAAGADSSLHLVADLSARKVYVLTGSDTSIAYDVAIGQPSYPTPTGHFLIRKIVWNPEWIPPDADWAKGKRSQPAGARGNPMKLVKIFFQEPDYYIHGTDDPASIGLAQSHGCLRMDPDEAYRLARSLMDHGGKPREESWFWRILQFRSETKTIALDHPIPMDIIPGSGGSVTAPRP